MENQMKHCPRSRGSIASSIVALKACALAALVSAALPSLTHAHWVYSDEATPENPETYVWHGKIEAYIGLTKLEWSNPAHGRIVNTHREDEVLMAIRVKCADADVSEWVYQQKYANMDSGVAVANYAEGVDIEWTQGALWVQD